MAINPRLFHDNTANIHVFSPLSFHNSQLSITFVCFRFAVMLCAACVSATAYSLSVSLFLQHRPVPISSQIGNTRGAPYICVGAAAHK